MRDGQEGPGIDRSASLILDLGKGGLGEVSC